MSILIDLPSTIAPPALQGHPLSAARAALARQLTAAFARPRAGWQRLSVPLQPLDVLNWWRKQPAARKLYWSDRADATAVAGIGAAVRLHAPADQPLTAADRAALLDAMHAVFAAGDARLRFYGGLRFDAARPSDDLWRAYGNYQFVLPRFELIGNAQGAQLVCNVNPAHDDAAELLAALAALRFDDAQLNGHAPRPLARHDTPDAAQWAANVDAALALFAAGDARKLVLARRVLVDASGALEPGFVLKRLQAVAPNSYHFCFQIDDRHAFVGASPERLYRRDGRHLVSEALAGTRRRGATAEEDARLAAELLASDKERHEQQLVLDSVLHDFDALCSDVWRDGPTQVRQLTQLQHLYNRVEGTLRPAVSDADIITTLHPTPAVGGFPRTRALREIARLESFDRGWYAAPLGWVGPDAAEFCVAIRSALVLGDRLAAYSGAGIVPGSTPAAEWDEIENKLLNFRRALM